MPNADVLAALAAAGDPSSSKPAGPAAGLDGSRLGGAAPAGPAIRIDDRVLLGAVLAQHLGPMCCDQYLVEAALLPLLDDIAGDLCSSTCAGGGRGRGSAGGAAEAGGGEADAPEAAAAPAPAGPAAGGGSLGQEPGRARLRQLLELLAAVLEPGELAALATGCCAALARRARASVWSLQEMPASPALAALLLWGAVLDCEDVRTGAPERMHVGPHAA